MASQRTSTSKVSPATMISRRDWLGGSAAALGLAAPLIVPRHVLGGEGHQPPSDKLRIAAVGVGGMGQAYLKGCGEETIVALCDLDHTRCAPVFQRHPDAARYHDFRRMFDKEASRFDALIIATPDHTHAAILLRALALKKHVYCAKPITHTIGEARRVRSALAATQGLITKASVQSSCTGTTGG